MGKRPGRVGDSALIGCGTYADSTLGAASCTGDGEAIIRVVLARRALDYLKEAGDAEYATRVAVDLLVEEGRGEGGLIVVDWRGRTGYAHSTPFMPVAWMSPAAGEPVLPFDGPRELPAVGPRRACAMRSCRRRRYSQTSGSPARALREAANLQMTSLQVAAPRISACISRRRAPPRRLSASGQYDPRFHAARARLDGHHRVRITRRIKVTNARRYGA